MTVYKAVIIKPNGDLISPFAKTLLKIGIVPIYQLHEVALSFFISGHPLHGKVSGFARKQDAISLSKADCWENNTIKIIKIKLGGTILIGSTEGICATLQNLNHITYAGTEILSIEEIKEA